MAKARPGERRELILQTLARMLEERRGERVTTAELAAAMDVSEAALYRHFSGKARMFEALLDFVEESLFSRINRILAEEREALHRLKGILFLVLGFADKNPGMARLLYGDILVGETERLRRRASQIYERLETQMRQILREAELNENLRLAPTDTAALLLAFIEGRVARFVRSDFTVSPAADFETQWALLHGALRFTSSSSASRA
ncbi:TetR family transcriptional regulator [Sulfurifustis variabilis]|uniref:Nucleoid occlusion factor SlmA n=1 Tax=Sulfurifustis variabilis TaxID=1675686 RepID=A0A1B4V0Z9_9GAMM|nr:nucleoid occlusion factor SlmA [Sulfurifustis variabilis]BAU47146.1 TetR family transcriptional regulator [Sulfurifustis variabilis]